MVIPRCFSSGALSIWSNGVKFVVGSLSCSTLVMAAVSVVFPWLMCPIVPTLTWGLLRSNFFLAITGVMLPDLGRYPLGPRHDAGGCLCHSSCIGGPTLLVLTGATWFAALELLLSQSAILRVPWR